MKWTNDTRTEYLTTQQVQSFFFSRMAAKCRYDQDDLSKPDITAAEEQQQMDVARQAIRQVQLRHPIVHDNLDICSLYKEKRLNQLNIAMLRVVCNYFDIATERFNNKRNAEYIDALSGLVLACDCNKTKIGNVYIICIHVVSIYQ